MFLQKIARVALAVDSAAFSTTARLCNNTTPPDKMEKTINTTTLLGRVGVEPQKRGTDAHPVVTFSLATHNNYRYDNGEWIQRTDWHRIAVFKPALRDAVMNHLKKGQRALVSGKISYGEITDQEGKQRLSTSIIADDVVFFQT